MKKKRKRWTLKKIWLKVLTRLSGLSGAKFVRPGRYVSL